MRLRVSAVVERVRASLFFVPMTSVVAAVGLGFLGLALDRLIDERSTLPLGFTSTVESARAVLGTIASATITFAGIAFSISVLVIQLASSQYSPRVVHTLFRDPFNKRVMGLVVGTFTYCVIVLRSVRSAVDSGGDPVIPNLSVAVAVLLGIVTILAVVAFIDHSAHAMDISEILDRVRQESVAQIHREWAPADRERAGTEAPPEPGDPAWVVRFDRSGWIQQVDADLLLECVPAGAVMRVEAFAGRYAIKDTPLCAVSPAPEDRDELERRLRSAVAIGRTRTMQQDVSYGLRQLADVALKALSPGINDPTTAQDAIFHSTAVLGELLLSDPPPALRTGPGSRRLVLAQQPGPDELVRLAFDETRRAAAGQPSVCVYLLEALHLLDEALLARGLDERTGALHEQARLIADASERSDLLPADRAVVLDGFEKRFGRASRR